MGISVRVRGPSAGRLAWLLLLGTVALSVAAALAWRAQVRADGVRAFDTRAGDIGFDVATAVQGIDDVTVAVQTMIGTDPSLSNASIERWHLAMARNGHSLGLRSVAYLTIPESRRGLCRVRAAVRVDLCAIGGQRVLAATRDLGQVSSVILAAPSRTRRLLVTAPIYAGGETPATLDRRRATLIGWALGAFDLQNLLGATVRGDRGVRVTLDRRDPVYQRSGTAGDGSVPGGVGAGRLLGGSPLRRTFSIHANGPWRLTVAKAWTWGPLTPDVQGLGVLALGLLIAGLGFAIVRSSARDRARALDVAAQRMADLRHQSLHDALTGLPNRAGVRNRVRELLAHPPGESTAALIIDIDNFSAVNDAYGYEAGDQLLRLVAEAILAATRDGDTVGRLGLDEFVVLTKPSGDVAVAELVASRVLAALRRPFVLDTPQNPAVSITASIGVATSGRSNGSELLRSADAALYEAKADGRNRYVVYESERHRARHDRTALELDLRGALGRDELFLAYQPIVNLADRSVRGVEALLRWRHPSRGLVSPGEFIPIAEAGGLITEIGAWVMAQACRQGALWRANGYDLDVAVNVSARQLGDPALLDTVRGVLGSSELDPGRLILEITETALMANPDAIVAQLEDLKALGVRIAVDDFGTGYSSLAYLQRFPVDSLKIDRAFVSAMGTSGEATALVHMLVQLGRTLDLETIAEGVEHTAQVECLRTEGCETAQGFLFSRPLEAHALEGFLAEHWLGEPVRR